MQAQGGCRSIIDVTDVKVETLEESLLKLTWRVNPLQPQLLKHGGTSYTRVGAGTGPSRGIEVPRYVTLLAKLYFC